MSVAPRIKVKALTRACYPACRVLLLLWLNTERPHAPWITAIRGLQPLLHLFNQCIPAVPPDNTFAASPVKAISSHSFNPRPSFPAPTEKFPSARAATAAHRTPAGDGAEPQKTHRLRDFLRRSNSPPSSLEPNAELQVDRWKMNAQ